MIEKLTKEQEAQLPIYLERYIQIGLSTEKCDRVKAEKAVADSYEYLKLAKPKFVWCDSPFKGAILAAQLAKGDENITKQEVSEQAAKASYGSFESYWISFYAFIAEQLPVKHDHLIDIIKDIATNCGVYWTFEDIVVMTEKPIAIHMVDKKLHNPTGLAIEYPDGMGIYALSGTVYPTLMEMTVAQSAA